MKERGENDGNNEIMNTICINKIECVVSFYSTLIITTDNNNT